MIRIRRALVSVSDKRGVEELARGLQRHGIEVLSTGGTARALREAGARVTEVAAYTGAPEILDGRVKTLHPKIHGGLLGRATPEHEAEMQKHGIEKIDLVVVNLYPFRETVARANVTLAEAIENIDIGGPSMIRSASKNHERVTVVVDPDDYAALIEELDKNEAQTSEELRFRLARKAFAYTAAYDGAIANWLTSLESNAETPALKPFPETLTLQWKDGRELRYGENPHQKAAFYLDEALPEGPSVARAEVLQGKELSFNNIVDLDAAVQLVSEFGRPAVAIIKHTNPCGAAESDDGVAAAYLMARECDPVSAFGGIVACNRVVDDDLGRELSETFLECVIAPGFTDGARAALAKKKSLRLLAYQTPQHGRSGWSMRAVNGGLLVQTRDDRIVSAAEAEVASKRAPSPDELRALDFAWRVCKHVKSNAIVFASINKDGGVRTVGVGAGQMSRVDSVKIARSKALLPTMGSVCASDAFFPFRDGVDAIAEAGATAIIQPGGSVRDDEVITAADEHNLAMVVTKMRHFRH
ncbi:MAG TPA: bifunctional phosphoribosylaminoimidazolecarboxamide formyltransferase/IMP cyclohydrolase [Polyangia bacterium]|nr:bifunctional phosphoribosylaminoimidazolecarboxamide formyltransferase/IMP cyclohydrolase [Polyangia bacterium]